MKLLNEKIDMSNYKVLIVDDLEKNLQLIGNHLGSKGLSLMMALNGKQALAAVRKKEPDLILLDISMPEMDGYEVCEILKKDEKTKDIPIIFLTAKNDPEDIIKGFAYGAVDYITKPFNKDELVSRVFTHIELKKSRDIITEQKKHVEIANARIIEHAKKVEDLNQKLNQQNQQLKDLNATKDKLFSIISHDLKNPISNILTFTELLELKVDRFDKEQIIRISKSLSAATENSIKLLENLLEWARSQTGELKYNPRPVEVVQLIDSHILLYEKAAEAKSIQLTALRLEEFFAWADQDLLSAVMRNLISNAIKFTPKEGSISILSEKDPDDPENMIRISVTDNGIGMTKSVLNKLFKVGANRSRSGTEGEQGTGLGLLLCKEFVEQNKGKIWVESEENKGTRFYFTVPVHKKQ